MKGLWMGLERWGKGNDNETQAYNLEASMDERESDGKEHFR